jgi:hypothetical protein
MLQRLISVHGNARERNIFSAQSIKNASSVIQTT